MDFILKNALLNEDEEKMDEMGMGGPEEIEEGAMDGEDEEANY